jgi:hypothetical protein
LPRLRSQPPQPLPKSSQSPRNPKPKEPTLTSQDSLKALLAPLLNDLDAQSRTVLESRYGLYGFPLTLEEIGAELSTTRERVRRVERLALETLRKTAGATLLTALKQDAKDRREALIEKKGEVQPEDLPNRFDLPWIDLAGAVCGVTSQDWKDPGSR